MLCFRSKLLVQREEKETQPLDFVGHAEPLELPAEHLNKLEKALPIHVAIGTVHAFRCQGARASY